MHRIFYVRTHGGLKHANNISCLLYYQTAVTSLVEECVASKQIAVLGGSHGGYIACHLLGQFPVNHVIIIENNSSSLSFLSYPASLLLTCPP